MRYLIIGILLSAGCLFDGKRNFRCYGNSTCDQGFICVQRVGDSVCLAPDEHIWFDGHGFTILQIINADYKK